MIKKIILTILGLTYVYLSITLFKYFSYWGLGFSAILLMIVLISLLALIIILWLLRNKTKLVKITQWLAKTNFCRKINYHLQSHQPRYYHFIKQRLNNNSPTGLYLTIGTIMAGIFFIFFISVITDLIFKDPLYLADIRTIHLIQTFISPYYVSFWILITTLANTLTVISIILVLTLILLIYKNYYAIKYAIISVSTGFISYSLIKWLSQRPRPENVNYITLPDSFSFPSGHAVLTICLFGFIAYLLFKKVRRVGIKSLIIISFLLLAITVGISRVYLGVHYPSDVIGGWYLGLVVLIYTITAYEIKNKFHPPKKIVKKRTLLTATISALFIIIPIITICYGYNNTNILKSDNQIIIITPEDFIKNAPLYSENLLGQIMEPISFIIIGNQEDIINLFTQADWYQAKQPHLLNALKEFSAIAKNTDYPAGPMTPAFYNEKANDLGFEKVVANNATARQRHHTRYWQTNYQINNKSFWVATASLDKGVGIGSIIKLPTHKIDPDIDKERELIFQDLLATGQIINYQKIDLVDPKTGVNASGDKFFTDGQAYIIELK